ncbi:MAG: glycerate-2-kinase family protein, partial [Acidimicrobiia bacterium]|nr:glycerate-2-kinase family protein [Acidimicrobiia bacterium]
MSVSYDPAVLGADPVRRHAVMDVVRAGIDAVEPFAAVRRTVQREGTALVVGGEEVDLVAVAGVRVIGLGKASVAMASAIESLFPDLPVQGTVVATEAAEVPRLRVLSGGHPVPDESSVRGAEALMEEASRAGPDELVVFALSGGGSALVTLPLPGLTLGDMQAITDALLRSGATIEELNIVRKHIDGIKGGRLLEAAAHAGTIVTLILSDVVGNRLDIVASGPTMPDASNFADALEVLHDHDLSGASPNVTALLK